PTDVKEVTWYEFFVRERGRFTRSRFSLGPRRMRADSCTQRTEDGRPVPPSKAALGKPARRPRRRTRCGRARPRCDTVLRRTWSHRDTSSVRATVSIQHCEALPIHPLFPEHADGGRPAFQERPGRTRSNGPCLAPESRRTRVCSA